MAVAQASTTLVFARHTWHTGVMSQKTAAKFSKTIVRRVVIHGIDQARAACQSAMASKATSRSSLELWSARSAAGSLGPAWFGNIIDIVRKEFPDITIIGVLDCGDAPGNALAALRHGISCIYISAPSAVADKIRAIALHTKADVRTRRPTMPDLMDYSDPSDFLQAHFS
ncbi:MAG: hypothetical protein GKS01_18265 [Alphaproteobacteria bacterium]|nr:hypothetical protein [Alphaproteobacteria bacterium]